jgi:tetratricopeptide (TPR) repeat protein
VRRLRDLLAELPPAGRWAVLGGTALVLAVLLGTGIWALRGQWEARAARRLAEASAAYRPAMAGTDAAALAAAAEVLRKALADHPRARGSAAAWYELGNLEYRRRAYDTALAAFEAAAEQDRGSLGGLSRLAIGYTWEAKGDLAKALAAYEALLAGRDRKDFLYGEALLGVARVQEGLRQTSAAVASYQRFLTDVPESSRAPEVRARLAILGSGA